MCQRLSGSFMSKVSLPTYREEQSQYHRGKVRWHVRDCQEALWANKVLLWIIRFLPTLPIMAGYGIWMTNKARKWQTHHSAYGLLNTIAHMCKMRTMMLQQKAVTHGLNCTCSVSQNLRQKSCHFLPVIFSVCDVKPSKLISKNCESQTKQSSACSCTNQEKQSQYHRGKTEKRNYC